MPDRTSARKIFVHSVPRATSVKSDRATQSILVEDQELIASPKFQFLNSVSLFDLLKKGHKIAFRKFQIVLIVIVFNILLVCAWKDPIRFAIADGLTGGVLLVMLIQTLRSRKSLRVKFTQSIKAIRQTSDDIVTRTQELRKERILQLKKSQIVEGEGLLILLKQAGIYNERLQRKILLIRKLAFELSLLTAVGFGFGFGFDSTPFFSAALFALSCYFLPLLVFSRIAKRNSDEVRYHLPLIAQQLVITTSGGMDIGTSLKDIYEMSVARERGNILMNHIGNIIVRKVAAGLSLSDALVAESGECCVDELKHFFLTLASTAKNGTELYRSMTATAEQAELMRFIEIEDRVRRLPVVATGALFLVFAGFFAIISAGLVSYITEAIHHL